jgi:hypothetical protein
VLGKQDWRTFGTRIDNTQSSGELIQSDVCGPMQESSFHGFRYFVAFMDDFSKYRHVYFMKQKSEVAEKLKQFLAKPRQWVILFRELLTDGGGEYERKEVAEILHQQGIITPNNNAIHARTERCCRTRQSHSDGGSSFDDAVYEAIT